MKIKIDGVNARYPYKTAIVERELELLLFAKTGHRDVVGWEAYMALPCLAIIHDLPSIQISEPACQLGINMPTNFEAPVQVKAEKFGTHEPLLQAAMKLMRRQPLGVAGLGVIVAMIFMAVFAEFLSPYDPEANSFENMLTPPNAEFWLGTDQFGRDVLTRLIYGSRTALYIGIVAAFVGSTLGLVLGVASAYFGGRFDLFTQRFLDVFQAFPLIIIALAIVATLGPSMTNVIVAIIIPFVPDCARVVRSNALAIREIPYVDAARALGFNDARIILRHMLPNVMAPYLIMFTSFVGNAILLEASLSYLGMGVNEPTPAWGLMLQGAAEEYAESAPWIAIWPGVAISAAVFGFSLFGDALRDVLDPKLRTR